jgi:ribonuclease R
MEFFLRQISAKRPDEFRAIVVDVRSYGLVVELPDCLVTGLIHVSALPDDFYVFDANRLAFVGRRTGQRYSIGAELRVIIARVDAYKRQLDFAPVGEVRQGSTRPPVGRPALPQQEQRPKGRGQKPKGGGKPNRRSKNRGRR